MHERLDDASRIKRLCDQLDLCINLLQMSAMCVKKDGAPIFLDALVGEVTKASRSMRDDAWTYLHQTDRVTTHP